MRDWMRWAILTAVAGWAPSSSEFVAGQPGHDVGAAHAVQQPARDLAQHRVAGQVAEAVVEELEAVHVQVQQGEGVLRVALLAG
jgi:hypothetical protein